jgi:hypothetical protein
MRRISRRAALLGVAAAGLAACSRAESAPPAKANATSRRPSPSKSVIAAPGDAAPAEQPPEPAPEPGDAVDTPPRWPLTGKPLTDASAAAHAAVAVKVPDNRVEHPQRGIDEADIVFVELDGYRDSAGHSGTRLLPVFHSRLPDAVEPVRSIRPVDIPLLSPMDALIGNTGAAPWVVNYVKHHRAHLEGMLSYWNMRGTGSYGTDGSRVYRQNGQRYYDRATVCHPRILAEQTTRFRAGPPQIYFPFASTAAEVSTAKGEPGRSIRVPYKGDEYFMGYSYDEKTSRYLRSMPWGPHVMADGTRVSTDNVLVIKAKQRYGKLFKGKGGKEPLQDLINGTGTFHYFNGGRYVTGRWSKGAVAARFAFTFADGSPFRMAPGQTFVELPDTSATVRIGA